MTYRLIRTLQDRHIAQLEKLYQGEFWCKHRRRDGIKTMLQHTDILIAIVDEKDDLHGFCRVLTDYVYKASLYDLIVSPEHRGNKLGKLLMDTVLGLEELADVEHIDLNCLEEMLPFYQHWQFESKLDSLLFLRRSHRLRRDEVLHAQK